VFTTSRVEYEYYFTVLLLSLLYIYNYCNYYTIIISGRPIRNRQWLSAWAILVAKNNYDVNTIDITILNEIPGNTTTYQSIDTVMNQDEVVKYPTEFT